MSEHGTPPSSMGMMGPGGPQSVPMTGMGGGPQGMGICGPSSVGPGPGMSNGSVGRMMSHPGQMSSPDFGPGPNRAQFFAQQQQAQMVSDMGLQHQHPQGQMTGPVSQHSQGGPHMGQLQGPPHILNPNQPSAPPNYFCGHCRNEVKDSDDAVVCEASCKYFFHKHCTGLTDQAFEMLRKEPFAEWVCNQCWSTKNIPLIKVIRNSNIQMSQSMSQHNPVTSMPSGPPVSCDLPG